MSRAGRPSAQSEALVLDVQVQPRASRERLGPRLGDRIKVALTAPPVDGAANEALVAFLARAFAVPRAAVTILRGHASRKKTVRIEGATAAALDALLSR